MTWALWVLACSLALWVALLALGEWALMAQSDKKPSDVRAWLICPSCKERVSLITEGVCSDCRYTLLGGDQAPTDLLLWPRWYARLATS